MNNRMTKYGLVLGSLYCLILSGCSDSPTESESDMIDSGSWYETIYQWPHDGHPVESEHFVVYSDGASMEAREELLQICEDVYSTIFLTLGMTDPSILRYPEGRNNKIHVYAFKYHYPLSMTGQVYNGGFLIFSLDHPVLRRMGYANDDFYRWTIKHEMMHVIQTLIIGDNTERIYSWFAEGIAIEFSGTQHFPRIDTQAELDALKSTWGAYNPIAYHHSWEYPNVEGLSANYLYPMFWLSFRYLIDPAGQGGSFYDARDVFVDVANGISFEASLEERFGLSHSHFENNYFDIMDDFLQ